MSLAWLLKTRGWPVQAAVAVVVGFSVFCVMIGVGVLPVSHIGWLGASDPAQYYVGWSFFRRVPYSWPPFANPDYGLELGSSIFYADAIPLLALPLRLIAPAAGPWQYHGAWLALCLVLQAFFAVRLTALFTPGRLAQALAAVLFCFAPVLMWRLYGHYSLVAQWLILAGFWLCLRPPARGQAAWWCAFILAAVLVHAYLFAMVLALWLADLVRRTIWPAAPRAWRLAEIVVVPAISLAGLWLGGFFAVSDGTRMDGFGVFRANLLSFVDGDVHVSWAGGMVRAGWSFFWPSLDVGRGDHEGFAFPGTGVFLLLVVSILARLFCGPRAPAPGGRLRFVPFVVAVVGMALFALSNHLALGPVEIAVVPLPRLFESVGALLRSSGRFVWPAVYGIMLWALIGVVRTMPARRAALVLAGAALVQVIDTAPGWRPLAAKFADTGTEWRTVLRSPFWQEASRHYARLRWIPTENSVLYWRDLSYFALTHGMATDAVYLARVSTSALDELRRRGLEEITHGVGDPRTLYVLDDATASAAVDTVNPATDLLACIDGLNVWAPGWRRHAPAPPEAKPIAVGPPPMLEPGIPLRTVRGQAGLAMLGLGWAGAEADATWTDDSLATLRLRLPLDLPPGAAIRLSGWMLLTPGHRRQRVVVGVGDRDIAELTYAFGTDEAPRDIPIRPEDAPVVDGARVLKLRLTLPDAARPIDLDISPDPRTLGLALRSITLVSAE